MGLARARLTVARAAAVRGDHRGLGLAGARVGIRNRVRVRLEVIVSVHGEV